MAVVPAPTAVPWRTVMREHHVAAPRRRVWDGLLEVVGTDLGDLSVESPWRHVRRRSVPGVDLCEITITLRDDGDECHLAWCAGTTAAGEAADALLDELAGEGERLLVRIAEAAP